MLKLPKKTLLLSIGITITLVIFAIVATFVKNRSGSIPSIPVASPTPETTPLFSLEPISSPNPNTPKKWSDPLGFLLTYTEGIKYIHQNDITQITPTTNQYNFVIKFYLEGAFKCEGPCSQKSTTSLALGDYTSTAKKVFPDNNNQYTLLGSVNFPSLSSNKPLYFFITYTGNDDLVKINEVLASFRFTEDYKIPQSEAINKVKSEQEVRDLIDQYGDEITVVNLYEDTTNKTWVVGVLRKPEDEPVTTIHQYAVDKFTGDVKLLF